MYRAIWRASGRRQIFLILLAFAVALLAAVPLEFQKQIINGLDDSHFNSQQLLRLCVAMSGAIAISLVLKWLLGYYATKLGEDIIRRLRTVLYEETVDHVESGGGAVQQGTLATSIAAEAEDLGKFTGNAFSEPIVQFGTLLSVIGYIAATQPGLGMIAIATILPQVVIVLMTQRKVNQFVAERVRLLRRSTDVIAASDLRELEAKVLEDFDRIYEARRSMFMWKQSTKFFLSLLSSAGIIALLFLGGGLVLAGQTDVGTVVAATIGLGRLQAPTSFLIAFYRQVSATRVKYELLTSLRSQIATE